MKVIIYFFLVSLLTINSYGVKNAEDDSSLIVEDSIILDKDYQSKEKELIEIINFMDVFKFKDASYEDKTNLKILIDSLSLEEIKETPINFEFRLVKNDAYQQKYFQSYIDSPEKKQNFIKLIDSLISEIYDIYAGIDRDQKLILPRNLREILRCIDSYFEEENFSSRKIDLDLEQGILRIIFPETKYVTWGKQKIESLIIDNKGFLKLLFPLTPYFYSHYKKLFSFKFFNLYLDYLKLNPPQDKQSYAYYIAYFNSHMSLSIEEKRALYQSLTKLSDTYQEDEFIAFDSSDFIISQDKDRMIEKASLIVEIKDYYHLNVAKSFPWDDLKKLKVDTDLGTNQNLHIDIEIEPINGSKKAISDGLVLFKMNLSLPQPENKKLSSSTMIALENALSESLALALVDDEEGNLVIIRNEEKGAEPQSLENLLYEKLKQGEAINDLKVFSGLKIIDASKEITQTPVGKMLYIWKKIDLSGKEEFYLLLNRILEDKSNKTNYDTYRQLLTPLTDSQSPKGYHISHFESADPNSFLDLFNLTQYAKLHLGDYVLESEIKQDPKNYNLTSSLVVSFIKDGLSSLQDLTKDLEDQKKYRFLVLDLPAGGSIISLNVDSIRTMLEIGVKASEIGNQVIYGNPFHLVTFIESLSCLFGQKIDYSFLNKIKNDSFIVIPTGQYHEKVIFKKESQQEKTMKKRTLLGIRNHIL